MNLFIIFFFFFIRKRHAHALIVCAFLLLAPCTLLKVLWKRHSASTWLLAVTAFSIEVIVKVNKRN